MGAECTGGGCGTARKRIGAELQSNGTVSTDPQSANKVCPAAFWISKTQPGRIICLQSDHFSIAIHSVMASPFIPARNPGTDRYAAPAVAGASYHAHNRPTLWP
jgi:hypothetical protein